MCVCVCVCVCTLWSRKRFCARVVAGSEDPEISSVMSDSAWLDGCPHHLVMGVQGSRFKVCVCVCVCVGLLVCKIRALRRRYCGRVHDCVYK